MHKNFQLHKEYIYIYICIYIYIHMFPLVLHCEANFLKVPTVCQA